MKLKEIESIIDIDDEPSKYWNEFSGNSRTESLPNGKIIKFAQPDSEHLSVGIFNNDERYPISYSSFIKEGKFWRVIMTTTLLKFRNKGYVRKMFDEVLDKYGPIMSDERQTKLSKEMWKALIKYPRGRKFFMLDKNNW